MVQTQLRHGVKAANERLRLNPLSVQLVVGQIEVLQALLHVGEHIPWNPFDLVPDQH